MIELTELEGCVLAFVASSGGCTAYRLRKEFESSLTAQWRASTGAIYPLVRRLERQGLVSAQGVRRDARGAKELKATPAGRAAAKSWLRADGELVGGIVPDPIRTRVNFLSLLSPGEQQEQVARMIASSEATLARLEGHIAKLDLEGDAIEGLVHQGARRLALARLEWLRQVREQLPLVRRPQPRAP